MEPQALIPRWRIRETSVGSGWRSGASAWRRGKIAFLQRTFLVQLFGMTDSPDLPAFTPAAPRARRDGWTAERQRAFIAALGELRSPTRAAAMVGMTREGAYALRRRPDAAGFAAAWDEAISRPSPESGKPSAYRRGVEGVVVPYFYGGLQRGEYRRYDDRALCNLLCRAIRASARRSPRSAEPKLGATGTNLREVPARFSNACGAPARKPASLVPAPTSPPRHRLPAGPPARCPGRRHDP